MPMRVLTQGEPIRVATRLAYTCRQRYFFLRNLKSPRAILNAPAAGTASCVAQEAAEEAASAGDCTLIRPDDLDRFAEMLTASKSNSRRFTPPG